MRGRRTTDDQYRCAENISPSIGLSSARVARTLNSIAMCQYVHAERGGVKRALHPIHVQMTMLKQRRPTTGNQLEARWHKRRCLLRDQFRMTRRKHSSILPPSRISLRTSKRRKRAIQYFQPQNHPLCSVHPPRRSALRVEVDRH